jgi:hypothetical protein
LILTEYYERFATRIAQDIERIFVDEFLFPLLGDRIGEIEPQFPFIDSTGRCRRIDFAYKGNDSRLAFEVNGETYHAEGVFAGGVFDDNLFRQNEILRSGYRLIRFSYSPLQSPYWRPVIKQGLQGFVAEHAPELLSEFRLPPTELQNEALSALEFYRSQRHWTKGVVILPTGTGVVATAASERAQGFEPIEHMREGAKAAKRYRRLAPLPSIRPTHRRATTAQPKVGRTTKRAK